ncbi:unnamed protein product [Protopolystoma xenopodis]|uniref:Uncharacterized protein n=1 Tax=Protopolystoma xenopodis TaxID=117903 RepID=A0A3S5FDS4_9PLAT|nr:unnamed protein product [Protopolystoma xenopodis]
MALYAQVNSRAMRLKLTNLAHMDHHLAERENCQFDETTRKDSATKATEVSSDTKDQLVELSRGDAQVTLSNGQLDNNITSSMFLAPT